MDLFASFYKNIDSKNTSKLIEMVDLQDAINKPVETVFKRNENSFKFLKSCSA